MVDITTTEFCFVVNNGEDKKEAKGVCKNPNQLILPFLLKETESSVQKSQE